MGYKPEPPKLIAKPNGTFSIHGWRVFPAGYWKGHQFNGARINGIIETYSELKKVLGDSYTPKLRLGHDTESRLMESMGLPNVGIITDLRSPGDGTSCVVVDIDNVPSKTLTADGKLFDLEQAIRLGNYDSGSIELRSTMPHPTDSKRLLRDVFDGVALLGEEHPAAKLSARLSPVPKSGKESGLMILAFSEFQPEKPMNPRQKLAMLQNLDESDAGIQAMSDADVDQALQSYADKYKKCFGDGMPPGGMGGAQPPVVDPTQPQMQMSDSVKQMFSDMQSRMNAMEATNEDLRKLLNGQATTGHVTMSDGIRRIDACVKEGKLTPQIAVIKKDDLKALYGLSTEKLVFSDGPNKGRSQVAVFLEELEKRPVDLMFSESIPDDADDLEMTDFTRDVLGTTRIGREGLRAMEAKKAA